MATNKRPYRKNVSSTGLLYLGDQTLDIAIKNMSLNGVLAQLENNTVLSNINDVFRAVQQSPLVTIYLPEMQLAGEAEIVRATKEGEHINLALEFRTVSYAAQQVLPKSQPPV